MRVLVNTFFFFFLPSFEVADLIAGHAVRILARLDTACWFCMPMKCRFWTDGRLLPCECWERRWTAAERTCLCICSECMKTTDWLFRLPEASRTACVAPLCSYCSCSVPGSILASCVCHTNSRSGLLHDVMLLLTLKAEWRREGECASR